MMNKSLKSIIVLSSICLIVALLLSSVDMITAPIISDAEKNKETEAFLAVLPDANSLEDVKLGDDVPERVLALKRASDGSGYAFKLLVTNNYSGTPMNLIVGIGNDGKIIKLSFIEYTDSPGIGSPEGFDALFRGKDNTTADNDAGATITTNAIKSALNDAYEVLGKYSTVEQSDEQKLATLWEKLMPSAKTPSGSFSFSKVEIPEDSDSSILGIFAPSNEIGYVYLIKTEDKTVAVAVNAFGKAYSVYDLEGNDLDDNSSYDSARKTAENTLTPIYTAKEKVNTRRIKNAFKATIGEEKAAALTLEALKLSNVTSSVTAAYKVKNGYEEYYAFTSHTIGYGGVIKVLYVFDYDGDIVLYKTTSQSESEGYGAAIADKKYAENIIGKDIDKLSDNDVLISGATVTSNSVKQAKADIKAAFTMVKEGL